ncbi:hypothetical protein KFE25_002038 [Diacronema lutheri]|uniref:PhoD-like phosphatase metallophosphatase domain-containing protein n=1 Tax=Diacronema lutheri TaxID=2081491 RepID=A0A8J6C999_DIALT|nr:hypothetical protein KFE25_002038 [Diacronema lutheri]
MVAAVDRATRGVWLVALALAASASAARDAGATTRVLFGSCNRATLPQPLWEHVLAREPDAWVWAGDNVYGDEIRAGRRVPATPARLRELYARQRAQPGYAQLLRSNATVVGTWDDHDFGVNDGDRTYAHREASQALFLDFIREPRFSARRRRRGVYGATHLRAPRPPAEAPASAEGARGRSGVLLIMLDVRYHKQPYTPDGTGDFLGEEQWAWLERTLRSSRARAHVLVSGVQVLSAKGIGEGWSRFPAARRRLLALLHALRTAAPLLVSGDIHMAELNLAACAQGAGAGATPVGTRLVELTSSGMTHSWSHRPLPDLIAGPVSDAIFGGAMHVAQQSMPWAYLARGAGVGAARGHGPGFHVGLNFGQVDFAWDAPGGPRARLSIVGERGQEVLSRWWMLAELDLFAAEPDGTSEWTCRPAGGGAELPTRLDVWRGLLLCAAKLAAGLALVTAAGARAVHVAWRALSPARPAGLAAASCR